MKKALFSNLLFVLFLIGLDVATKQMALAWIPPMRGGSFPFGGIALFENLGGVSCSLNLVGNTGMAWGFFSQFPQWLLAIRLAIIAVMIFFAVSARNSTRMALWFIIGGALGNSVDMILHGYVIDFFHFQLFGWSFPLFNVADSCITLGALFLIFWPRKKPALV